jgi:hypothetical protein
MYTNTPKTRSQKAVKTPEASPVVCTECGSLECLCRPRFFSGQLLTEEDLNRLDRYIIAKHRLHNRMLFGWGVVNGLEVKCSPCNDQVIVTAGYALSPCGDDIILCKEISVDICAMVDACTSSRQRDCGPYSTPEMQDCPDVEQEWVLAVCYEEKSSRGITPLRDTGSRCNCGSTSNCGCQGKETKTASRVTGVRGSASQCEPTVICEGYHFTLFRPAEVGPTNDQPGGRPLAANWMYGVPARFSGSPTRNLEQSAWACLSDFISLARQLKSPTDNSGVQDLYKWCCSLKDAFQNFLAQHGGTDCTLYDLLNSFRCPDPISYGDDTEKYKQAISAQIGELAGTLHQYVQQCLCSAVLSPLPAAMQDNCVPLATVTLRRKDCRIIKVCNTDVRKFAITFANLSYWFSSFEPFLAQFREALDRLCCSGSPVRQAVPLYFGPREEAPPVFAAGFAGQPTNEAARMIERFRNSWMKQDRNEDPRALVLDALRLAKNEDKTPYLNQIERENPIQSMLLDQLVVPFLSSMMERVTRQAGEAAPSAAQPATEDLAAIKTRLDELAATVETQQATISEQQILITELQKRPGKQ